MARGNNVRLFRRYVIGPVPSTDTARIIAEGRRLIQLKEHASRQAPPAAAMRAMGADRGGIVVSDRSQFPSRNAGAGRHDDLAPTDNELSDPIVGNGGVQLFERVLLPRHVISSPPGSHRSCSAAPMAASSIRRDGPRLRGCRTTAAAEWRAAALRRGLFPPMPVGYGPAASSLRRGSRGCWHSLPDRNGPGCGGPATPP